MNNHFAKLFRYDHYANNLMCDLMVQHGSTGRPVDIMAHVLSAQQVWLNRCRGVLQSNIVLWPTQPLETLFETNNGNFDNWAAFVNTLQPQDFDRVISYKNTRGEAFENTLGEILTHVINHGTHHRAQIGSLLKEAGAVLPVTDYILYIRNSPSN